MAVGTGQRASASMARPPLRRIYFVLLLLLGCVSSGLTLLEPRLGYSVLLGGLISVVPNSYFARQAFRYTGARYAHYVTRGFYLGQAGKFMMTTAAFALAFARVESLQPVALVVGFIGMTVSHLVVCARFGAYGRTKASRRAQPGATD